jgi:hypothetical protein
MFQKIADYFGGRHTLFVVSCMTIGIVMSWFHRLYANLVSLLLGLQGLILAHSIKEDHYSGPITGGGVYGK